ncbi:MAG TPA: type III-B CRISPR module RAMP protein Cmr6 [Nannocystaceae bacterium]|nr:type III-B CRISPR module RAMP protein Cmr6 [Nannocystaceae bacterium]
MDACRSALRHLAPTSTTHAGLWLDRFLPKQPKATNTDEDKGTIQAHIKRLADIKVPDAYRHHCNRWTRHIADLGEADARTAKATVRGRMIIGLGAESVLETAIHLHHTYGVPVIPGSALKGLAADYARNRLKDEAWHKSKDDIGASYRALFGDTTEAGCVIFHDALWIPPEGEARDKHPLDLDVMTVHHRDYYGTKGKSPPADSDDPNPVSFVTARGTYLIALEGPPDWTDAAMSILKHALAEEGIGAKTAAGYGRLDLDYNSPAEKALKAQRLAAEEALAAQRLAAEEARKTATRVTEVNAQLQKLIDKLHAGNAKDEVPHICKLAMSLPAEERPHIAQRCIAKLGRDFPKALKSAKTWATALQELGSAQR